MSIEVLEFSEVKELNNQATMLIARGKYEEAKAYLDKAQKINSMDKETYKNFGEVYANQGDYHNAEKYFKKVLLIDKKDAITYFNIGNVKFLKGEIEAGIENYNKAISYGYEEGHVFNNLGMVYEETDNIQLALRNYSKAISKDKLNPEYRLRQIALYIKNENYSEALELLEELNEYCPDMYEGYHLRFEIYCSQEKYDKAEDVITKAIKMFPKDVSLLFDKVKLLNLQQKYEEALELINKGVNMEEYEIEERNFLFEKAKIYAQKEDVENTIKILKECIAKEKDKVDFEVRYFLMNAYLAIKDYDNVLVEASLLEEEHDNQTAYVLAAMYYKCLAMKNLKKENWENEYKEKLKLFRALTITDSGNLDAYMFRILCHKDLGEFKRALELVEYVILIKEDISEVYHLQGTIYTDMGEKEKAEKSFNKAKSYDPMYEIVKGD